MFLKKVSVVTPNGESFYLLKRYEDIFSYDNT